MGGYGLSISGALYGHKTALLDTLRDGSVPRWLHPDFTYEGKRDREEMLEEAVEWAKARGDTEILTYRVYATRDAALDGPHSHMTLGGEKPAKLPPEAVRQRLEDYLNSEEHEAENHACCGPPPFRGLHAAIKIGPRGGITDAHISASYRDR